MTQFVLACQQVFRKVSVESESLEFLFSYFERFKMETPSNIYFSVSDHGFANKLKAFNICAYLLNKVQDRSLERHKKSLSNLLQQLFHTYICPFQTEPEYTLANCVAYLIGYFEKDLRLEMMLTDLGLTFLHSYRYYDVLMEKQVIQSEQNQIKKKDAHGEMMHLSSLYAKLAPYIGQFKTLT